MSNEWHTQTGLASTQKRNITLAVENSDPDYKRHGAGFEPLALWQVVWQ